MPHYTKLRIITAAIALSVMAVSSRAEEPCGGPCRDAGHYASVSNVRDLALIYQGGAKRIDWNKEQLKPYIVHQYADGRRKWLFDGLLFLDFSDGNGHNLAPGYEKLNANRDIWEWYLGRIFEPGKSLDALDGLISEMADSIGQPDFRHQIYLTLPTAIPGQKDWGELNGRKLDFEKESDRLEASRWFVDRLAEKFSDAKYKNLELAGIYWVDEDMVNTKNFTSKIAPYIHYKGLRFIWIPYFKAPGFERWRELGFDIAYHQPNHFFSKDIPDSRLDEACRIASANGMAMEFECDERAMADNPESFAERMTAYMDAFVRNNVFSDAPIAYYTGNHLLLDMHNSANPKDHIMADRLADYIISRRATLKKGGSCRHHNLTDEQDR